VTAADLSAFLHILVFVYWLGGDLGVYCSAYFITNDKLSSAQRATAAKIMGDLDLVPRFCLILTVPTGLWLGAERGWFDVAGWQIACAFGAAVAWIAVVVRLHHHASGFLRSFDLALRFLLIAGLVIAAGLGLAGQLDVAPFLAVKMLILAGIVCVGVAVRFVLAPFGPAFGMMMTHGATPELDAVIAGTIARVRPLIWLIYAGVAGAAFLGLAMTKPF
jgi:hypothetical protein